MSVLSDSSRPARILIIEDDRAAARLLEVVLQKAGYETCKVGNGLDGLAATRTFAPDAILLDLELPGLSGGEVLQAVRTAERAGQPVVIVLTATAFASLPPAILNGGADSHCNKPIAPSSLLRKLQSLQVPPCLAAE